MLKNKNIVDYFVKICSRHFLDQFALDVRSVAKVVNSANVPSILRNINTKDTVQHL